MRTQTADCDARPSRLVWRNGESEPMSDQTTPHSRRWFVKRCAALGAAVALGGCDQMYRDGKVALAQADSDTRDIWNRTRAVVGGGFKGISACNAVEWKEFTKAPMTVDLDFGTYPDLKSAIDAAGLLHPEVTNFENDDDRRWLIAQMVIERVLPTEKLLTDFKSFHGRYITLDVTPPTTCGYYIAQGEKWLNLGRVPTSFNPISLSLTAANNALGVAKTYDTVSFSFELSHRLGVPPPDSATLERYARNTVAGPSDKYYEWFGDADQQKSLELRRRAMGYHITGLQAGVIRPDGRREPRMLAGTYLERARAEQITTGRVETRAYSSGERVTVQLGAFATYEAAERHLTTLAARRFPVGTPLFIVPRVDPNHPGRTLYGVQTPVMRETANRLCNDLKAGGIACFPVW